MTGVLHAWQPMTLSASVVADGGAPPTGTISFVDGAVSLGSLPYTGGTVSLTTSWSTQGSHSVVARFIPSSGDDASSASQSLYVSVVPNTTAATLIVTPRPTHAGDQTTLIAAISTTAGTPTGTVTFYDGETVLATQPLSSGRAVAVVGPLARGAHTLSAKYVSDSTAFFGSTAPPVELTVDVATTPTSTTLAVTPETSTRGQAVTLTASVAATGGTPLGNVVFVDGDTVLDTQPLSSPTVSITTSSLAAGTHTLTAVFVPLNGVFGPSTSAAVVHVVAEPPAKRRAAGH
jgi:hypothetical protein